jgi:glycosyltransferase involved in cell wall biosynthesis
MEPVRRNRPKSLRRPSLTVLFPAHNEEDYVAGAIRLALRDLAPLVSELEILVVDDASTDRTRPIAESIAREDPRVRVLAHERNRTLGATLRTGFANARQEFVLYSDIDLPFDLSEVARAFRAIEYAGADAVFGYRHDRTSEGLRRTIYSFAWNWIVRLLFGVRVRDVNFSFKLLRRSLLDRFPLRSEGSFIDAELVVRCQRHGARIAQIGIDYFPRSRGVSKLSGFRTIRRMLAEMLRIAPELRRGRAPAPSGTRLREGAPVPGVGPRA